MPEHIPPYVAETLDGFDVLALTEIIEEAGTLQGDGVETIFEHHVIGEAFPYSHPEYEANENLMRSLFDSYAGDELFLFDDQVTIFKTKLLQRGTETYKVRTQEAVGHYTDSQHFLVGAEITFPSEVWFDTDTTYETSKVVSLGMHTTDTTRAWDIIHALSFYETTPEIKSDKLESQTRILQRSIDPSLFQYFCAQLEGIKNTVTSAIYEADVLSCKAKDQQLAMLWHTELDSLLAPHMLSEFEYFRVFKACSALLRDHIQAHQNHRLANVLLPDLLQSKEIEILQDVLLPHN